MADPLSLGLELAKGLLSRVSDAKRNGTECQCLEDKIEQTLTLLEGLGGRVFDFPTTTALERVSDALTNAKQEVDKCSNTGLGNALLHTDSYALALKHAAEKLEHALSQVPLATLGTTADMQSDVNDISTQIRTAKFETRARAAHLTTNVKDVVEKASNQSSQENTEIKKLIYEILRTHSLGIKEIKEELTLLQQALDQPKQKGDEVKEKEDEKRAFKFGTIFTFLSQSLADGRKASGITPASEDYFRCPISKEIMRNPVMLKESDVVYDRSSIEDWLKQGHQHDYVKKVRLESKDLVPIPALRLVCQSILEQFEAHSSTIDSSQEEDSDHALEPGLYEGRGRLCIDSKPVYTSQLLILEPSRGVVGCTSYKGKAFGDQENNVAIGAGKWDGNKRKLSFLDNQYCYHGTIERLDNPTQATLTWNTKASIVEDPQKICASTVVYSPPFKGPTGLLYPTILQCEGSVDTTTTQAKYRSKLVLSLEVDSTIGGWTCFESGMQESKFVGRIVKGKWYDDGHLKFSIHFSHDNTQSNLGSMPLDCTDAFDVVGFVKHDEGHDPPSFTLVVRNVKREGILQSDKVPMPLNGLKYWECSSIFEVSNDWFSLLPRPSKLFQVSRNLELERSQCNLTTNVHLEHSLGSHLQHELGWSSLHIASVNNSVSIIRELIASGADVNQQQRGGHTPLHLALLNDHIDVVQELIASGANVNLQDSIGRTPLHIASKRGRPSIVRILLNHGASKEVRNVAGMTPYDFVCVGRCLLPFERSTIEELRAILET